MLEQSSALRPFMRQSRPFALVAMGASKDGIGHIMTRSRLWTRDGNRMVKVIDVATVAFLEMLAAIVATVMLQTQLLLYLLIGQRARDSQPSRPALVDKGAVNCSAMLSMPIPLPMLSIQFLVCLTILLVIGLPRLSMAAFGRIGAVLLFVSRKVVLLAGADLRPMLMVISAAILKFLFPVLPIVVFPFFIDQVFVFSTITSIICPPLFAVIGAILPIIGTFFFPMLIGITQAVQAVSFAVALTILFSTGAALRTQPIFFRLVAGEKVRSRGVRFIATSAIFARGIIRGYTVHTVETSNFYRHAPVCSQHARGHTLLPLHYTTSAPPMQLHALFPVQIGGEL